MFVNKRLHLYYSATLSQHNYKIVLIIFYLNYISIAVLLIILKYLNKVRVTIIEVMYFKYFIVFLLYGVLFNFQI